jgi:hypothetical protein
MNSKFLAEWRNQLITPEDKFHIHKILAFLVVLSTLFRLAQLFASSLYGSKDEECDMGFRSHPEWTVPTVFLHAALNISSFQFHLPERRIKSGYRIWPEYRLHSLVFLLRSLVAILLNHVEQKTNSNFQWPRYTFLILVLSTMALADVASRSVRGQPSGFARELDAPALTKYFFSVAQCGATAYVLAGDTTQSGLQFIFVMIIQWNAFFMTLRRKNLASQTLLMTFYGVMLGLGIVTARPPPSTRAMAHLAAILRTGLGWNKYLLWTVLYIIHAYGFAKHDHVAWFHALDAISFVPLFWLGYYKHRDEQRGKAIMTSIHSKQRVS